MIQRWTWTALLVVNIGLHASADSPLPVDFDTEVIPILTKAGCNAGACHGAATGRGEFRLSLFGSRPADDFLEITHALEGRRINHRTAAHSLLLSKPTEQVSHEGGTRLNRNGIDFQRLERWISEGAKRLTLRQLQEFHVDPSTVDVKNGESISITALASFSDGTKFDVLPWTVLTPDDPTAIKVEPNGLVTLLRSGRHVLIARYLNRAVPIEFLVATGDPTDKALTQIEPTSIDGFVDSRLMRLGLRAAEPASDGAFVRRLCLDLTGRLPSPELRREFVDSDDPQKRDHLIDKLLSSDTFTDYWTNYLARLLRVTDIPNANAAHVYYGWIGRGIREDLPFDEMVRQLILADGPVATHGAANFYAVVSDPRAQAEFVSRALLGVRLQCANCHDHPFDVWTQDDYHGLAAVFAGVKRGDFIRFTQTGEVIHPGTGEPAVARIPGGPFLSPVQSYREELADWLTSRENPYFAQAIVNRLWSRLMGRGLVEPVDDLRVSNPPTHPELLKWLQHDFVEHGYQIRHTIAQICRSDAYGRSSDVESKQQVKYDFYAVANRKPLSSAVYLDAISDVTEVAQALGKRGDRAVSLAGLIANSNSLDTLGRCSVAECGESRDINQGLAIDLYIINGDLLNDRLTGKEGFLMNALSEGMPGENFIRDSYLRCYSREPNPKEQQFWLAEFSRASNKQAIAEDFLWALLSSDEFREIR